MDTSLACESCRIRNQHPGAVDADCNECWTQYVLRLIDNAQQFGADPQKIRDRVFEELSKRGE